MSTQNRILTGLFIAVLIVGVGLAAGYYFRTNPSVTKSVTTGLPFSESAEPNHNTYDISPPSRGGALTKFPVELTPKDGEAVVTVPANSAVNVKTGQKVLLYDKEGMLLEILGAVQSVTPTDNNVLIAIKLNGDANYPSSSAARGEIVTDSDSNAQRLPLTAMVKDGGGNPYVWEVTDNDDGTNTAYYKAANVIQSAYEFFAIRQENSVSNVFVLNPDEKLRDGQKINVRKILFSAPAQTDDVKVASLIESRLQRTFVDPYRGKAAQSGCGAAGGSATPGAGCSQATTPTSSVGCGTGNPDVLQKFIQKIRLAPASVAPPAS